VAGQEHAEDGRIVSDMGRVGWSADQTISETSRWAASEYGPTPGTVDWPTAPSRDEGVTSTGRLRLQLDDDQPADDDGAAPRVEAQWALWGKDDDESDYRVLRCSNGTFGVKDFYGLIARYASGVNEALPQYTVCWIPSGEQDDHGYLAVGIHELADRDPRRSGGLARAAAGREIEYIRLFCVRYDDLAAAGVRYTDLIEAVREQQLPATLTKPITVTVPDIAQPRLSAPLATLAENVAALLLTTRPVCILGVETATAKDRLVFIESVMSLLPYGLRTTMSAATWASATAQDLKLRLFFSNARRDDAGRTINMTWDQLRELDFSAEDDKAPELYLGWLRQASPGAVAALFALTDPVRFNPAEIRTMVADLPEDRPVEHSLRGLANSLRHRHQAAVTAEVQRLRRYLSRTPDSAERSVYQSQIAELGLLHEHAWLHPSTKASVYRVLLDLAFETKLSYASYCDLEDAAGRLPSGVLRSVLLKRKFATFVPWVLVAKAEPGTPDEALMESLAEQHIPAAEPLTVFLQDIRAMRPDHRPPVYQFAVGYLCTYSADAATELIRRGYLADVLEVVFPGNRKARQIRLEDMLRFVYGGPLSKAQIVELFANPKVHPTRAFEAAVTSLAPRKLGEFIKDHAALARLRQSGDPDDVRRFQRTSQRRSRARVPDMIPQTSDTIWMIPKRTIYAAVVIFGLVVAYLAFLWLTSAHP
jgi:hypothetical protein